MPKKARDRLTAVVQLGLTDRERVVWNRAAAAAEQTLSDYIRHAVRDRIAATAAPPPTQRGASRRARSKGSTQ